MPNMLAPTQRVGREWMDGTTGMGGSATRPGGTAHAVPAGHAGGRALPLSLPRPLPPSPLPSLPPSLPAGVWRGADGPDARPADALALLDEPGLHDVVSPHGLHAVLAPHGPLVWVQDARSRSELGCLHARGLAGLGLDPSRVTLVRVSRPVDALWAMEEALRAGMGVMGEVEGAPRALDFTATRRLEVRARAAGVVCRLARVGPRVGGGSSGARWRWRVLPHPSAAEPHDPRAPGRPCWVLELSRARDRPPGRWVVEPDDARKPATGGAATGGAATGAVPAAGGAAHRLRVVAPLADGGVAAGPGEGERRGGTVVPFRPGRAA